MALKKKEKKKPRLMACGDESWLTAESSVTYGVMCTSAKDANGYN